MNNQIIQKIFYNAQKIQTPYRYKIKIMIQNKISKVIKLKKCILSKIKNM